LIPLIGWCYWFSEREDRQIDIRKQHIHNTVNQICQELAPRGITVQFLDGSQGGGIGEALIFEVQPLLPDGRPNSNWTGPAPVLQGPMQQSIMMDYQVYQGVLQSSDLPKYEEVYAQSSGYLEQHQQMQGNLSALAHDVIFANWFAAENPRVNGPLAAQSAMLFEQACQRVNIDPKPLLANAALDLKSYQTEYPDNIFINNVRQESNVHIAQQYLTACQRDFLDKCALAHVQPGFSQVQPPDPTKVNWAQAAPLQFQGYGTADAPSAPLLHEGGQSEI